VELAVDKEQSDAGDVDGLGEVYAAAVEDLFAGLSPLSAVGGR